MTRNIIRKLKLREISLVDRPAQPGALVAIMKRDTTTNGEAAMDEIVSKIMKRDGCSRSVAMERAAVEDPAAVEAFQKGARETLAKRQQPAAVKVRSKPTADFEKAVNGIIGRDNCTRTVAIQKAAAEKPELIAAFYDKEA